MEASALNVEWDTIAQERTELELVLSALNSVEHALRLQHAFLAQVDIILTT